MIHKLDEIEFLKYFETSMRLIEEDEETSGIDIREYVLEILRIEELEITLDEIEIPYVYEDSNKKFEHILLSYGIKDCFIVIVTNMKGIIGYHNLNLREKYGLEDN